MVLAQAALAMCDTARLMQENVCGRHLLRKQMRERNLLIGLGRDEVHHVRHILEYEYRGTIFPGFMRLKR
jgi:hypothetical protein